MAPSSDDTPLTPDEIEQRQSAVPDDEAQDSELPDEPLDPDQIEQRQEVGWEDDDRPA